MKAQQQTVKIAIENLAPHNLISNLALMLMYKKKNLQ